MHRSRAERTGENAAPLAKPRRWGGAASPADEPSISPSSIPSAALAAAAAVSAAAIRTKRDRDDENPANGADSEPRKRRSRWGDASTVDLSHLPTAIPANVSKSDLDKYAIQVRLEEISRKLASGDVVPAERDRSPSPPPTYDNKGHRTNTREVRYRKKLDDERVALVERQMALDPTYRAPAEYHAAKRNTRPSEKVYLPIKEFPEINFFGLLVGPRGNTLKGMERESGAKISIRGKGSVKDGKGRPGDEDEEEMHCVVNADDEAKVKKCVRLINLVIETAASTPESENDHKRNQLRELAALNGTLRDDENQICQNCGGKGHRRYECPEERNWTAHITCHKCGQQGHLARDCTSGAGFNRPGGPGGTGGLGAPGASGGGPRTEFDSEYANLMAELGGGPAPPGGEGGLVSRPDANHLPGPPIQATPVGPDGKKIPPWRNPDIWNGPGQGRPMHSGPYNGQTGGRFGYGPPAGTMGNQGVPADHGQGWPQGQAGQPQLGGQTDYTQAWQEYYAAQAAAAAAGVTAPDGANLQGAAAPGQTDYSREWAEYYKQMGIVPPTS